jgi:hypothetical protein
MNFEMATSEKARARADEKGRQAAARYRHAAEETLDQLDWCVSYLYRIRKPQIAKAIEQNRSAIRRRMRQGDD